MLEWEWFLPELIKAENGNKTAFSATSGLTGEDAIRAAVINAIHS